MRRSHLFLTFLLVIGLAPLGGCAPTFGPNAKNGMTFYCPGAGNIDFGDVGVRDGLMNAGYRGEVAAIAWTVSLNPAIDQLVRVNARNAGTRLAEYIRSYKQQYPNGEVNVIGLSAGTGVAVWACEDLQGDVKVNNVVLLGSSLDNEYDLSKALRSVKGKIYCYYSANDSVLAGPMKVFGTIDGKFLVDGAGSVGFKYASRDRRVVNIAWRPEFQRYGYAGGHTDSTSPEFVRAVLSSYVLTPSASEVPDATPPTRLATVPPAARRD